MTLAGAQAPFRVVAMGASAGGVEALAGFFRALPDEVDAAFLVVLHIPAQGESHLPGIIAAETGMAVATAQHGEPIRPRQVYVAQADHHLMASDGAVRLTRGPRECRVRPSVDVLFRSVALHYGPLAVGVVLSGSMDDGSAGLWAIKDRGGTALVQDPSDASFGSMPQSALRHVAADLVGTPAALAAEVVRLTRQPHPAETATAHSERLALESLIASEGHALQHGVMALGKLSRYTCPECHGVLVQIEEGSIVRFRCPIGHAYSIQTLLAGLDEVSDAGLWATVRALEERLLLLRQICEIARAHGSSAELESCEAQAQHAESRIQTVRELALDPRLFGALPLN